MTAATPTINPEPDPTETNCPELEKTLDAKTLDAKTLDSPVIFFDGECIMCNTFLDWMMAIDQPMTFKVAPLQGKTAAKYLPPLAADPEDWSIYVLDETGLYNQSDAVIRIAQRLGGVWAWAGAAGILPKFIRDGIYQAIAANRYRMFGKRECRLPNAEDRARFLP